MNSKHRSGVNLGPLQPGIGLEQREEGKREDEYTAQIRPGKSVGYFGRGLKLLDEIFGLSFSMDLFALFFFKRLFFATTQKN